MARAAYHISSLKPNEIPAHFQAGIIVLKWPEDTRKSPKPIITHLSIDTKGFYLICHDKFKNEIECFDMALIHDTRTGSQVSLPQSAESFDQTSFGVLDVPLTSKWVSIYYGNTFVVSNDLRILHFCFQSPIIAREWTEQLFRYGHNPLLRNLSSLECLEKIHCKILHGLIDVDRKTIPVQSLIQFLCKNNRDIVKETKIRQTLGDLKLPYQIDAAIDPKQFTFKKFLRFYMQLMDRHEIEKLFDSLDGNHRRSISWENLKLFIKKQNDIHNDPFGKKDEDLIRKYTQYNEHSKDKGMSDESFLRYLLSFDNLIFDPTILDLYMDMNKPLAHYLIASSHNTYLTGSQITGRASVEMYRQVLLTGCRCIELDVVESEKKNDEPEIKHIYTPIKPVLFLEVILAIREYAFKVTSYPLILSIENHCGPKAQAKMAQYFVDVFGENLITEPLNTHPCEENQPLPSPNDLKYKILIKNKKIEPKPPPNTPNTPNNPATIQRSGTISASSSSGQSTDASTDPTPINRTHSSDESLRHEQELLEPLPSPVSQGQRKTREGNILDDEYCSDDGKGDSTEIPATIREAKATRAMSDLVHYIVPIRFKTFARAEERNKSFEISSFAEDKAHCLIRDHAREFLAYNHRQLSRIYPRGTRFESSNYNPYIFWPIGCQMVALNYQTLDIPMQLNLGLFSFNGACGYLEKPSALCQSPSSFDPRIQTDVENVVSYQINLKILSGQFLCQDREPTFVDIHMYGMYGDINKRHEYRIRAKRWNGFQAIYDDTDVESEKFPIQFAKVILPEMAALRFSVTAEDGGFLGQCFLPIAHLRPGYRHVVLRNLMNIPINSSSLFLFIQRKICINAKDQEFTDRLVQPLVVGAIQSSHLNNELNGLSSNMLVRFHTPLTNEFGENYRRGSSTGLIDESQWYQKHLIAGSELNNIKNLSKILSVNDIDPKEVQKREQTTQHKLRRLSVEYQKDIRKEEERFQECLKLHGTILTNSLQTKTSAMNTKDIERIKQSLLKIYSEKFSKQEELEYKHLHEYYKTLDEKIKNDYNNKIHQIHSILKREKAVVNEHVRAQIKKEANDIAKNTTEKTKLALLKERSLQKNEKSGAMTIQTLEDMYEKVKEILHINLQTNLYQLEKERAKEVEICLKKYSDRFNALKLQLYPDEHNISPNRSRMTSVSLSTISHYSSEVLALNQQPRRQTTNQ